MAKKGENIYKRKDGRFEARYPKERDEFNKIIKYGFVYGKTYTEAKLKREEALKNYEKNINKKQIYKSYFNNEIITWLSYKEMYVKKSTYYNYLTTINSKVLPYFKKYKLRDINKELLMKYIQFLKGENLSNKRIKDIFIIVSQFLKFKCISIKIELPKNKRPTLETLNKNEFKCLVERLIISEDVREFAIVLVLYTGLRIGELCALKWGDIDLDNRFIYINKTLVRVKKENDKVNTEVIVESPKTNNSIRKIPIHEGLISYLNFFRKSDDNYFLSGTNYFISNNKYYHFYKSVLKQYQLKNYNFHILRHTFATNALLNGMDVKSLSEILGHSSVKMTLDRYVHIKFEEKVKQINLLPLNY